MTIFALVSGLCGTAEAKEYKLLRPLNEVTAGETLSIAADTIEPGSKEWLVRLVLTNKSADRALMVRLEELQCFSGAVQGQLRHAAFGIGERRMDLRPGEMKDFTLICETGPGAEGEFKINVTRLYDDSTGDLLMENVAWTLTPALMDKKANKKLPAGFVPRVTDHPTPPPAGAAPTEPEGLPVEAAGAITDVVKDVVEEVKEHTADDGAAPAEEPKP